jgi:hypothetical protein
VPQVFRTTEDHPDVVELVGIGVIGARGRGGIPIARAAELGMPALQEKGDDGAYVYGDDGALQPLHGAALSAAAKHFVDQHPYLVLDNVKDEKLEGLAAELGGPPDEVPPAGEKAVAEYEASYGGLTPVNDDPEAMATATVATEGVGTQRVPGEEVSE